MADILRGEIWWANLNPTRGREQSGTRPVLIISKDLGQSRRVQPYFLISIGN